MGLLPIAGIGLGIVQRLAREGARVVVSSRRQQNVDETVAALKAQGLDVVGCVCHVGNPEHIKRLVKVRAAAWLCWSIIRHVRQHIRRPPGSSTWYLQP